MVPYNTRLLVAPVLKPILPTLSSILPQSNIDCNFRLLIRRFGMYSDAYHRTHFSLEMEGMPVSGGSVARIKADIVTDPVPNAGGSLPQWPRSARDELEGWMNSQKSEVFSSVLNPPVNIEVSVLLINHLLILHIG
jgi:hypothetical protein